MKLTEQNLKELIDKTIKESKTKSILLADPSKKIIELGDKLVSLQKLDETTMKALKGKYMQNGFIVITSDRTCEAEMDLPEGEPCPDREKLYFYRLNQENSKTLQKWIRSAGFGYTPVFGGYREKLPPGPSGEERFADTQNPENSFLIMARSGDSDKDHNKLKELGMQIADSFNQDSFFYKPPNSEDQKAYFIKPSGQVDMEFSNFVFNDLEQIYYTQLARGKQKYKTQRFSAIPESIKNNGKVVLWVRKHPVTVQEARRRMGEIFVPKQGE